MKILWDNYLKTSTITASSENASYPLTNLYYKMLERKYMATANNTTITVDFGVDKPVSMIAYGFNNVQTGASQSYTITKGATDSLTIVKGATDSVTITKGIGYELKSSGGTVLASGMLNSGDNVNATYLDTAVTCRSAVLKFAAETTLFIGGLSIGDPFQLDNFVANPTLQLVLRGTANKTDGGQLTSKRKANLKRWRLAVEIDNDERLEIEEILNEVGKTVPFYFSLADDSYEEPMFCNYISSGVSQRDSYNQLYGMSMTVEECK